MSHLARGPKLRLGIDGKANAAGRRRAISALSQCMLGGGG
jgi:hypothetical protein